MKAVLKRFLKTIISYLLTKFAYSKPMLLVVANEGFFISAKSATVKIYSSI